MSSNAEQVFRAKAPWIMSKLMADFPITSEDAAAIVGNAGHESLGFTAMQEFKPTVAGSRGGWGWMQWTGPRRRAFEAYCKRTGKDLASEDANYAWLYLELKGIEGTEGGAIAKTVAAKGLAAKVEAFEKAFLRAGVKHYPSRKLWAQRALDAHLVASAAPKPAAAPKPSAEPTTPPPAAPRPPVAMIAAALIGIVAAAYAFLKSNGVMP